MKRWEELPDVPGWERDLTLPTLAVYRRVFPKAVVLVSLSREKDAGTLGPDYWWHDGIVCIRDVMPFLHSTYIDDCPFGLAERLYGRDS